MKKIILTIHVFLLLITLGCEVELTDGCWRYVFPATGNAKPQYHDLIFRSDGTIQIQIGRLDGSRSQSIEGVFLVSNGEIFQMLPNSSIAIYDFEKKGKTLYYDSREYKPSEEREIAPKFTINGEQKEMYHNALNILANFKENDILVETEGAKGIDELVEKVREGIKLKDVNSYAKYVLHPDRLEVQRGILANFLSAAYRTSETLIEFERASVSPESGEFRIPDNSIPVGYLWEKYAFGGGRAWIVVIKDDRYYLTTKYKY